ncbi:Quinolinate phosphoribosyltransferase [decarboxylating] (EC [Bathymodiolus thermophilus thioautotrophic gill symbiont]|jgi:nicotinate-nucleotide pyrophosphorylase (carboxylating)|nr:MULTISPECIES: carboxylating nicotinate-nucleotide diphosphorylase [sulfur-oxidizing symbionts]CAC9493361.1 Quinolinate phosphoribosyltransferase [decarboxylating] (EC 2.4.2.19) [uncultured Gammaproteobacteria bacterium]CAB5501618.1 Quinolinate phosphoribosyltransferase [decarboxylating] (EC [Bathymodiolus thermophilus thioautotrophic gill symbiont]CAC9536154.1 Quinolinate phosphoribosyltransferase [decarboxylating] (EC 2.4.2.19) [uncultured Gammaproteobacteria bacterium]CAC9990572.1 Quinolin
MSKINDMVALALDEDIGTGDVSASLLDDKIVSAQIIAREPAVICGIEYAQIAFLSLDKNIQLEWHLSDGDSIQRNQVLCTLSGATNGIISAERVALNFLQMLSSVATQTKTLVGKIAHTNAHLLDTRKTIPGLRLAQKQAVECGGGMNHRMGLYDCVMLKENHIIASGSIKNAVQLAKEQYPNLPLIVEVENLTQLSETLTLLGITRVLCDNFSIADLIQAVELTNNEFPLEASGNIDKDTIVAVAETGVDYISTGSMTKNIQAIDLSLRFLN